MDGACLRAEELTALLTQEGWTSSDRLAIHGRSAGGLTIGAAVTMSPDTFKACSPSGRLIALRRTFALRSCFPSP